MMSQGLGDRPLSTRGSYRLRRKVVLTVAASILCGLSITGPILFFQASAERRATEERAQTAATAIAENVEREIASALALLRGLAGSPALHSGDYKAFYDQARATEIPENTWIVAWDEERQLLNTRRAYGEPLPRIADFSPQQQASVARIHQRGWSVSGRNYGVVGGSYVVSVSLSVPRSDGRGKYMLTVILSEPRLRTLVDEPLLPPEWVAHIFDRDGKILLTTLEGVDLNAPPPAHWLPALLPADHPRGTMRTQTPGRMDVFVAHDKARNVDWTTAVTIPLSVVDAPIRRALERAGIAGGVLLLGGIAIGSFFARRWERPIKELSDTAALQQTQLHATEQDYARARELLHASMNARGARLAVLDASGTIVLANEAWQSFSGSSEPVEGANYRETCESPAVRTVLERVLGGDAQAAHIRYGLASGAHYQARIARFDHEGRRWFVVTHEDVTEIEMARRTVHELADHLTNLQEQERQRIARELHDSTAQHLAAVGLNLMRLKLAAGASADAEQICRDMKSALREAQKELRVFTYLLHPPELDSEGLKTTVERFVEGVSQRTGLRVRARISPAVDDAAFEIQRAVFRVLQEALTNVHRHAKASRVLVLLNVDAGFIHLFVKDDGRGLPATNGSPHANRATLGVGIPGMEARMRRFGGELSVRRASRGTVVRATVPVVESAPVPIAENLAPDRLDLGPISPAASATVH